MKQDKRSNINVIVIALTVLIAALSIVAVIAALHYISALKQVAEERRGLTAMQREAQQFLKRPIPGIVTVELLWCEEGSLLPSTDRENGRVVVKAGNLIFEKLAPNGEKVPDLDALTLFIEKSVESYKPSGNFPTLPVCIRKAKSVPLSYLILALKSCHKAGAENITFAEIGDE